MKFTEYLECTRHSLHESNSSSTKVQPRNLGELRQIITDTVKEKGLDCDLNFIDTSKITDMALLFNAQKLQGFNGDISKWDVSNVKSMECMFMNSYFNGDISNWDVSKVETMESMFAESKFNGDISKWDVSNVWDMDYMFANSKFNQDISKWDVSSVENMTDVFEKCPIKEEYKPKFNKNYGGWA